MAVETTTEMCSRNVHIFNDYHPNEEGHAEYHCRDCGTSESRAAMKPVTWRHLHRVPVGKWHCEDCGAYIPPRSP